MVSTLSLDTAATDGVAVCCRSRGKESEYENLESDAEEKLGNTSRDSEQREIDEFEEEERRLLAEEEKVSRVPDWNKYSDIFLRVSIRYHTKCASFYYHNIKQCLE